MNEFDIEFLVGKARLCEASLECADFLDRIGQAFADVQTMLSADWGTAHAAHAAHAASYLRDRARALSDDAFRRAAVAKAGAA